MTVQIRKIGNSFGVILPKEILNTLGLKDGDTLEIHYSSDNVKLAKENSEFSAWAESLRKGMVKYDNVLHELAK